MQTIGPVIGMALLGLAIGWLMGRICIGAMKLLLVVAIVFLAIQLLGYGLVSSHSARVLFRAREAVHGTGAAAQPLPEALWTMVRYNVPFSLAFFVGFLRGILGRR